MSKSKVCAGFLVTYLLVCFGNCAELYLKDKVSIKISLLPEAKPSYNVSENGKTILRYGFHRTQDCQNFEKAFICIRKCLDLNYQIAHADKTCICTCYKNSILGKYKKPITDPPKWKLGAPTTSLPPWAAKEEPKPDDYEINANVTELIEFREKEPNEKLATSGVLQDAKQASPVSILDAKESNTSIKELNIKNKPNAEESPNKEEKANEEGKQNAEAEPNTEEEPKAEEKPSSGGGAGGEPIAQDLNPEGESNAEKNPNAEDKSNEEAHTNEEGEPNSEQEPRAVGEAIGSHNGEPEQAE